MGIASVTTKKLWLYPLLFSIIGSFLGLVLRYSFIGSLPNFNFKNVLHAHSHVMLMGFLFNAILIFIWKYFSTGIDKRSYNYYLALQVCMSIMVVAFVLQGYALYSILFSTLHLWISYIILIRLWKRLDKDNKMISLVKVGIIFHFISSLGPYALGPLMALDMKESAWYQQSIFFYLHFQFLGLFFVWMLAIFFQRSKQILSKIQINIITVSLIFLYAHSLDYNFDHWLIQFFGGLGSILLFLILFSFNVSFLKKKMPVRFIYYLLVLVAIINIIGSLPQIALVVRENRFVLIAWLHFLFLGLYVPFIWVFLSQKINSIIWIFYGSSVLLSEAILIFPNFMSQWLSISVMHLLLMSYFGILLCLCTIHLQYLIANDVLKNLIAFRIRRND